MYFCILTMNIMEFPKELNEIIAKSQRLMILTGAGVSRESGLDTFRDVGGYWSRYNPYELASPQGFRANPLLVWQWYQERKNRAELALPNPGHYAIAEMEKYFSHYNLFTQNVDRLHHRAGSKKVYELHGTIFESRCFDCNAPYLENFKIGDDFDSIPHCPKCNGLIRPSVVWFGESLPIEILHLAYEEARKSEIFLTIGTSSEVYPAAELPHIARNSGSYVIEINPNQTSFTQFANLSIREKSGIILPKLLNLIKETKSK